MIYIEGMAQISAQEPLCEKWYDAPLHYSGGLVRPVDPDFKAYIPAAQARRMSLLLKRAAVTAKAALAESGIAVPAAIVTSTGSGTMRNTESFLHEIEASSEQSLPPTSFINSTHNTIGSYVAIMLGCDGYNMTYSHNGMSFESALLDVMMYIEDGAPAPVLLSSHDELTDNHFRLLDMAGEFDSEPFVSEHSVSFVIGAGKTGNSLAAVEDVRVFTDFSEEAFCNMLAEMGCPGGSGIDLVISGDPGLTGKYLSGAAEVFDYKEIFGAGYSASAMSLYSAAAILRRRKGLKKILLHNRYRNRQQSLVTVNSVE